MREIITFDPRKYEHLEAMVKDLQPGDLVKTYFARRPSEDVVEYVSPPKLGRLDSPQRNRVIVGANNLPDDWINKLQKENTNWQNDYGVEQSHYNRCFTNTGIFNGLKVEDVRLPRLGVSELSNNARTKPALWMNLSMTQWDGVKDYLINEGSTLYIDVDCLGAYEKLSYGYAYPLKREDRHDLLVDKMPFLDRIKSLEDRFSKDQRFELVYQSFAQPSRPVDEIPIKVRSILPHEV